MNNFQQNIIFASGSENCLLKYIFFCLQRNMGMMVVGMLMLFGIATIDSNRFLNTTFLTCLCNENSQKYHSSSYATFSHLLLMILVLIMTFVNISILSQYQKPLMTCEIHLVLHNAAIKLQTNEILYCYVLHFLQAPNFVGVGCWQMGPGYTIL